MTTSSAAEDFAARALGVEAVTLEPSRRGANAKVFRVLVDGHPGAALKSYPAPGPGRDRYACEVAALTFLAEAGEGRVPRLLARDAGSRLALLSWIPGAPGPTEGATAQDIDQALAFVARLKWAAGRQDAAALAEAAEATLSADAVLRQIERREARLSEVAGRFAGLGDLLARIRVERDAVWATARRALAEMGSGPEAVLPPGLRTLSPSDFGFHNAVRDAEGRLVFLDFEYFGWDSPTRLALDFELHPGMSPDADLLARWHQGLAGIFAAEDPGWCRRLAVWRPLLGLRWTLILLNEFLPERWRHRIEAGVTQDRDHVLRAQLAKADAMLSRVSQARRAL